MRDQGTRGTERGPRTTGPSGNNSSTNEPSIPPGPPARGSQVDLCHRPPQSGLSEEHGAIRGADLPHLMMLALPRLFCRAKTNLRKPGEVRSHSPDSGCIPGGRGQRRGEGASPAQEATISDSQELQATRKTNNRLKTGIDLSPRKTHRGPEARGKMLSSISHREMQVETTVRSHLMPTGMALTQKKTQDQDTNKQKGTSVAGGAAPPALLVGTENRAAALDGSLAGPTVYPAIPLLRICSGEIKPYVCRKTWNECSWPHSS